MYSQRDEEAVILANVPATGRFLDIGAGSCKKFSNTWRLLETGWSGVLVEASPRGIHRLEDNTVGLKATIVQALMVPSTPEKTPFVKFMDTDDFVGTADPAHFEKWKGVANYAGGVWLRSVTVYDLLVQFPGPYQLVSVDIEGLSGLVFDEVLSSGLLADVLVVEYCASDISRLRANAAGRGYREIHKTGENLIFKRT